MLEVAFNHIFREKDDLSGGGIIYFPGFASPGIYSRLLLEVIIQEDDLKISEENYQDLL